MTRFCRDHLNPVDSWIKKNQITPKQHAEESVEIKPHPKPFDWAQDEVKPYDWQNELDLTTESSTVLKSLGSVALDPRSEIIACLQEGLSPESDN